MANETLRSRAMLVALNQRAWKGKAADKELAAKAEREADAEQGTMTLIKQLVPKPMIDRVQHALTIGRQEHYRMTTPGLFRGQHLLATAMFEEYMLTQQGCRDEFWKKVNEFLGVYPDAVAHAKAHRLGSSFKGMDFPSVDRIKGYFDYNVVCGPVPDIHDWRLEGIDSKDVSELRNEVEEGIRDMYVEATRLVYDRARTVLESLISQAKEYSLDAPGARLRDATIDNIKQISALVCDMNVTNDPVLEKVGRTMLKEFADLNGHELRRSAELRDSTAKMAQSILAKMVAAKKNAA